jgi:MoxR-like ATPase
MPRRSRLAPAFHVATTAPLFRYKQHVCAACGAAIFEFRVYRQGSNRYHREHHPDRAGSTPQPTETTDTPDDGPHSAQRIPACPTALFPRQSQVSGKEQRVAGFKSTEKYIATRDLEVAVNAAVTLQRPLLVKGEPGTGKTILAHEVAASLDKPLIEWHVKSTTKAQQGLYEYDAVSRLRDGQLGDPRVHDIGNYIVRGKLWDAFEAEQQSVVLIDEVDKADIEFPNDLLLELDRMEFFVYETRKTIVARHRPVVIITSNNEKELPDAFLRRCFFHYIRFPDRDTMERIVHAHYPDIRKDLAREALNIFFQVRDVPGLKKKPATSELLDWLKLLMVEDMPIEALRTNDKHLVIPPLHGALLKNEQDVHLFERLAFLARRGA